MDLNQSQPQEHGRLHDAQNHPRWVRNADTLRELGRARRGEVPRASLSHFYEVDRDPVELIEDQNKTRVPWLVPLRRERMLQNPFTFFRGTAILMAHDLAHQVDTRLPIVICGDAHINNFGLYSSPERNLVFDLNDFDEASPGPWEWDLDRLITSLVIAARYLGFENSHIHNIARQTMQRYRIQLHKLLDMDSIDRYYYRVDEGQIRETLTMSNLEYFEQTVSKANRRTAERAFSRMLETHSDGSHRFILDPPILTADSTPDELLQQVLRDYLATVSPGIRMLLDRYSLTDIARRVVGVGSVGTRCFVLAMTGPDGGRIILQLKEANQSVVSQFWPPKQTHGFLREGAGVPTIAQSAHHGERVISYQQVLQAVSDPFLGFTEGEEGQYYVRQFRDKKGSFELEGMSLAQFRTYLSGCATMLARAHSQSPNAYAIGSYLGHSDEADHAFAEFALSYADKSMQDFIRYKNWVESAS